MVVMTWFKLTMFRTFDSPAQPLTYKYQDYTLHILLHKSPTPTQNKGLQYQYCSRAIDIAVTQNGTAISPAVPNPYTKWGLQYRYRSCNIPIRPQPTPCCDANNISQHYCGDDDVATTSICAQPALDSPPKLTTQLHKATSYPFEMDV